MVWYGMYLTSVEHTAELIFPASKVAHFTRANLGSFCQLSDGLGLRKLAQVIGNGAGQEDRGRVHFWLRK